MKQTLITILILATLCGGAWAQPKVNGNAPTREKRGYNQRVAIDTAHVRVSMPSMPRTSRTRTPTWTWASWR